MNWKNLSASLTILDQRYDAATGFKPSRYVNKQMLPRPAPQVRSTAAEIVSGLTASPDGIEKLKSLQRPLVTKLFRSVGLGGDASRKCLVALVNLSQDPSLADLMLELNVVNRVMELVREGSSPHVDLLVSLLCCGACRVGACNTGACARAYGRHKQ